MVTPELVAFIRSQLASRVSTEKITSTLIAKGWQTTDIQEAFRQTGYTTKELGQIIIRSGSISSLLSATFQVFQKRWLSLLALSVLTIGIFILATIVPGPLMALLFAYIVKMHPAWYVYVFGGLGYILFIVISGTLQSWGPLAIIYLILHRNERTTVWQTLGKTRRQISRFWSLGLISALSSFGAFSLAFSPLVLVGIAMTHMGRTNILSQGVSGASIIFGILSLILGIIISFIIIMWLSFSAQTMVDNDLKSLDAMVRSKQLVTGNIWFILLRLSIPFIFSIIFSLVTMCISLLTNQFAAAKLVTPFISTFLSLIFGLIYATLFYEHVRDHRTHLSVHKTRDKVGFVLLSVIGVLFPVVFIVVSAFSFGPQFAGFFQGALTKQLDKSHKLPSPIPTYLQNQIQNTDVIISSPSASPKNVRY